MPMAYEPLQSLPYPGSDVIPDGPAQIKALADAVVKKLTMVFASTAARDAAFAAASVTPSVGMKCVIGSGASMVEYVHDGTNWVRSAAGPVATFTPVWRNTTIGNGSTSGNQCRIGQLVVANFTLTFGSTTAFTGHPYLLLAENGLPAPLLTAAGAGVCYDASAPDFRPLTWSADDWILSPSGRLMATSPWTWAASDYLRLSLAYLTAMA